MRKMKLKVDYANADATLPAALVVDILVVYMLVTAVISKRERVNMQRFL